MRGGWVGTDPDHARQAGVNMRLSGTGKLIVLYSGMPRGSGKWVVACEAFTVTRRRSPGSSSGVVGETGTELP